MPFSWYRTGVFKWWPTGQTRPAKRHEMARKDTRMTNNFLILLKYLNVFFQLTSFLLLMNCIFKNTWSPGTSQKMWPFLKSNWIPPDLEYLRLLQMVGWYKQDCFKSNGPSSFDERHRLEWVMQWKLRKHGVLCLEANYLSTWWFLFTTAVNMNKIPDEINFHKT